MILMRLFMAGLEQEPFYEELKQDFHSKLAQIKGLTVPEAALLFSDSDVTAYVDGENPADREPDVVRGSSSEIALPLKEKMVLVNESRGTGTDGEPAYFRRRQFYLKAPIDMKEGIERRYLWEYHK